MGQAVLDATATATTSGAALPAETSSLRVYAHCTTNRNTNHQREGAVTVLAINLGNRSSRLHFAPSLGDEVHAYVLTPSEGGGSLSGKAGLLGTGVLLNAERLALGAGGELPAMAPVVGSAAEAAVVPPTAVGFYVLPGAAHAGC